MTASPAWYGKTAVPGSEALKRITAGGPGAPFPKRPPDGGPLGKGISGKL
ncbi:hypothetical protein [Succinimonas amylolytica]|nr:hypothetical protein [Succinimonas amylolytica]